MLFHQTGILWMARETDPYSLNTRDTLLRAGVPDQHCEKSWRGRPDINNGRYEATWLAR